MDDKIECMTTELSDFDSLWDYGRPAETEARFRELLPAADDSPALGAELLTQIARAQGLQGRFAEAHATLDDLEPNLSRLPLRPRIRYLLELGRVYNSSGDLVLPKRCNWPRLIRSNRSSPSTRPTSRRG